MDNNKIKVGITHGDINGIGYEIIYKTFSAPEMYDMCTPVVYGSAKVATYHRKGLNINVNYHVVSAPHEAKEDCLNLINCFDGEVKIEIGHPGVEAGKLALLALERAVQDLKDGKIDVLVTAPICKSDIQSAEFNFAGHTEFLHDRVGEGEPLMILCSEILRVALATTHLPLREVPAAITKENLSAKLRLLHESLRRDFLKTHPRIAVLSLNPHAGDNGLLGQEEQDVIAPVIAELTEEGVPCFGPYAADGFFGSGNYVHFDAVLAMYHDQGLAPFKALAGDDGYNFTAGLPVVRTSPDHGTAFDIAGQGVASENSFRKAIYAAIDIYRNRQQHDEAYQNPLPKLYRERREEGERGHRTQTEKPQE